VASLTVDQRVALIEEIATAEGLLRAGLEALQKLDGANRFYRLPLSLLAQGLERLMKVAIALVQLEDAGTLPTVGELRKIGHDLTALLDRCAAIAAEPAYHGRSAAADDAAFLATDRDLRELVVAIAAYGDAERYADLGRFLGDPAARAQDPDGRMSALEAGILKRYPEWEARLAEPSFRGFYPVLVGDLTATVQRLARAVSRFLVWDLAGEIGREASGLLTPLLSLGDKELRALPRRWRPAPVSSI
jgi:hypothetical protein